MYNASNGGRGPGPGGSSGRPQYATFGAHPHADQGGGAGPAPHSGSHQQHHPMHQQGPPSGPHPPQALHAPPPPSHQQHYGHYGHQGQQQAAFQPSSHHNAGAYGHPGAGSGAHGPAPPIQHGYYGTAAPVNSASGNAMAAGSHHAQMHQSLGPGPQASSAPPSAIRYNYSSAVPYNDPPRQQNASAPYNPVAEASAPHEQGRSSAYNVNSRSLYQNNNSGSGPGAGGFTSGTNTTPLRGQPKTSEPPQHPLAAGGPATAGNTGPGSISHGLQQSGTQQQYYHPQHSTGVMVSQSVSAGRVVQYNHNQPQHQQQPPQQPQSQPPPPLQPQQQQSTGPTQLPSQPHHSQHLAPTTNSHQGHPLSHSHQPIQTSHPPTLPSQPRGPPQLDTNSRIQSGPSNHVRSLVPAPADSRPLSTHNHAAPAPTAASMEVSASGPPPAGSDPWARLSAKNESFWVRTGALSMAMGHRDQALESYERVLRHNPNNVTAMTQVGAVLAKKEEYQRAIQFLQQAIVADPNAGEAWAVLAHCYVMTDELHRAYQAYQNALGHLANPKDPNLWYGIGLLYDRYGSLEHALEAFLAVLNISPDFERAEEVCFCIGIIYKEQQEFEKALEYFNLVVRADRPPPPLTRADAWYQIGHVNELKKDINRAVETYRRALEENPRHPKTLQQLGWLQFHQGNSSDSLSLLRKSVECDEKDGQSWYLLGRVHMALREFREAYDAYQQAVYRDGRNSTFWCSIGVLYYQMSQYRDAMDAYSRAIRLNPYVSEVWYDLGSLYESCQQIHDAIDAYKRAAELTPDNEAIRQRLESLEAAVQGKAEQLAPPPAPVLPGSGIPATEATFASDPRANAGATPSEAGAPHPSAVQSAFPGGGVSLNAAIPAYGGQAQRYTPEVPHAPEAAQHQVSQLQGLQHTQSTPPRVSASTVAPIRPVAQPLTPAMPPMGQNQSSSNPTLARQHVQSNVTQPLNRLSMAGMPAPQATKPEVLMGQHPPAANLNAEISFAPRVNVQENQSTAFSPPRPLVQDPPPLNAVPNMTPKASGHPNFSTAPNSSSGGYAAPGTHALPEARSPAPVEGGAATETLAKLPTPIPAAQPSGPLVPEPITPPPAPLTSLPPLQGAAVSQGSTLAPIPGLGDPQVKPLPTMNQGSLAPIASVTGTPRYISPQASPLEAIKRTRAISEDSGEPEPKRQATLPQAPAVAVNTPAASATGTETEADEDAPESGGNAVTETVRPDEPGEKEQTSVTHYQPGNGPPPTEAPKGESPLQSSPQPGNSPEVQGPETKEEVQVSTGNGESSTGPQGENRDLEESVKEQETCKQPGAPAEGAKEESKEDMRDVTDHSGSEAKLDSTAMEEDQSKPAPMESNLGEDGGEKRNSDRKDVTEAADPDTAAGSSSPKGNDNGDEERAMATASQVPTAESPNSTVENGTTDVADMGEKREAETSEVQDQASGVSEPSAAEKEDTVSQPPVDDGQVEKSEERTENEMKAQRTPDGSGSKSDPVADGSVHIERKGSEKPAQADKLSGDHEDGEVTDDD